MNNHSDYLSLPPSESSAGPSFPDTPHKGKKRVYVNGPYYERRQEGSISAFIGDVKNEILGMRAPLMNGELELVFVILSYREYKLLSKIEDYVTRCRVFKELFAEPSNRVCVQSVQGDFFETALDRRLNELFRYGRLFLEEDHKRFVIGFCDFKNSTDLLSATATCFFRSLQNRLLSSLSGVITELGPETPDHGSKRKFRGYIDKYAGDNIMFYFQIDGSESETGRQVEAVYRRVLAMVHKFEEELDSFATSATHCPGCTHACEKTSIRPGFHEKYKQYRKELGIRIGLVLASKPVYLSMLGLQEESGCQARTETDYTFTGEDVNLAARLESLKEDTMLYDLDRCRSGLERYRERLFEAKGAEETSVMKEREALNILADDIFCISKARLSVRVNAAFYRKLADSEISMGSWKKVRFIPKGFSASEEVYIQVGSSCRKKATSDKGPSYYIY